MRGNVVCVLHCHIVDVWMEFAAGSVLGWPLAELFAASAVQ